MKTQEEWEAHLNTALKECQHGIVALDTGVEVRDKARLEALQLVEAFVHTLREIPSEYHAIIVTLHFSKEDLREWLSGQLLEQFLAISPTRDEPTGKTYELYLLTPRKIDFTKSGFSPEALAHRGSYVREYRAEHPDIETVRSEIGSRDLVTKQRGMIRFLPRANPMGRENFLAFPRNVRSITLTRALPQYLDDEERDEVLAWYQREVGPG